MLSTFPSQSLKTLGSRSLSGKTNQSRANSIQPRYTLAGGRGLLYVPKVQCSEGPIFRRFYIPKVLYSEGSMFRMFYIPKVLCSEGSIFRRFYVPKVLYFEGSMFRKSIANSVFSIYQINRHGSRIV